VKRLKAGLRQTLPKGLSLIGLQPP